MDHFKKYNNLKSKWEEFRLNNKKTRIRDAALKLNVSEAELLSTEINKKTFLLIITDLNKFFKELFNFDSLMFLVRNDLAVHEKIINPLHYKIKGESINSEDGNCLLDIKFNHLKYIFYQNKIHKNINLRSFQFFDDFGNSIIKIYLKSKQNSKFDELALKYKTSYNYQLQSKKNKKNYFNDYYLFNNIKLYYKNNKSNIIEINRYTSEKFRSIIELVSEMNLIIQIIIIGKYVIQYHEDNITKIVDFGPWFNIMDKSFNLHILEKKIEYIDIKKYSVNDKIFCCVEVYDKHSNNIIALTSKRDNELNFLQIIKKVSS